MVGLSDLKFPSALAALVLLAACGSGRGIPTMPAPAPQEVKYRLGPGDKMGLTVFGNPNLTGPLSVESDGNLAVPLIGRVKAGGRTVEDVQDEIRARLDKDFVVDPRVSLEVANYRPFFILGEVAKPGSYPYIPGLTARQAVAVSGGFTRRAQTGAVTVIRNTDAGKASFDLDLDDPLLPGDTIEIGRRIF